MKLATQIKNTGLRGLNISLSYVIEKAMNLGFLPYYKPLIENPKSVQTWTDAKLIDEHFNYPSYIGELPICKSCSTPFNTVIKEFEEFWKSQMIFQFYLNDKRLYNAIVVSILYIAANELQGQEQEESFKILSNLFSLVPKHLQDTILGIQDSNIKYIDPKIEIQLERPARPLDFGNVDEPFVRGTEPNQRGSTEQTMFTTGMQSAYPKETAQAQPNILIFEGETRTPQTEKTNYPLYIGLVVLFVAGVLVTVELVKPDKKKKKKR